MQRLHGSRPKLIIIDDVIFHKEEEEDEKLIPRLDPWNESWLHDRINGVIYNSSKFADGTLVTTSPVASRGDCWVQTLNTFYILGKHDSKLKN